MSLSRLREYRHQLLAEDDRVSYWRRLVQARLDLQRAGAAEDGPLDVMQIVAALRDTGAGLPRQAFAPIASETPFPDMPALLRFWQDEGPAEDTDGPDAALAEVEAELSQYRRAVHGRLDEASVELVERYRQAPAKALALLPVVGE